MNSDITQMTVLELKALRKKIDKQIRVAERAELKQKELDQKRKERENLALLKQKAKELGVDLNSIKSSKRVSVPKYQNPDNPEQTWTGMGRKPNWVVKLIEAGGDLSQALI